ncbi:hypothetical protein PHET_11468 [Paragonimus heterotremus]|uniref:Uncharacterized protein n=1 Tax=Paragonimus heterotremus TaxID=100268 RepID=A0A8J4SJZ8_9TREM|nr:hypothetical protein PHET_11468 [Paragonimus heterotremus]
MFSHPLVEKAERQEVAVIPAEDVSETATLLAKGFSASGELRRIDAAEDTACHLSRYRNITYLPEGQHILLNLPTA